MIDVLSKMFPARAADLKAPLVGVAGFTGVGALDFTAYDNGERNLSVRVNGVAGQKAELYVDDVLVSALDIKNGRGHTHLTTRNNARAPMLMPGCVVEVRQNGAPILRATID